MSEPQRVMSQKDAAALFNRAMRRGLFGPASEREQPVFVGIGGPPGIGKSTAQVAIRRQLGLESAYLLDGDEFLPVWPGYEAAQRRNDLTAAYLASEATSPGRWWQRAARFLRSQRRDVVATWPMAYPGWDIPRLAEFRHFARAPYRTVAVYVVGPEALSLQGMALRYHAMRRDQGLGRWVLPETHDLTLAGTLRGAEAAFEQAAVHELHGMRRDGTLIYSNSQDAAGTWRLSLPPRHVFESERARPLDAEASAQFLRGQGELREVAERVPEWGPLVDSIDRRALPVISPLVLLSDADLATRLRLIPLIREQAVLEAEWNGVRSGLLLELYAQGRDGVRAQAAAAAGAPASEMERLRSEADHARFAQGLTAAHLQARAEELTALNGALTREVQRRAGLTAEQHGLEARGRAAATWPPSQRLLPLPAPVDTVVLRRRSPSDPGPGINPRPAKPATPSQVREPQKPQPAPRVSAPPPPRFRGRSL